MRSLLRIVAMIMIVAAAANAQCALSCGLLAMSAALPGAVSGSAPMQAEGTGAHACCPHRSTPRTPQAPATSCPEAGAHSNDGLIEANRVPVSLPVLALAIEPAPRVIAPDRVPSIASIPPSDSPGPNLPRSVTVLRI